VLSLEHAALRFFERTAAEQPPTAESLEAAALARRAADRGWAGEEGLLPVWELAAALTKFLLTIPLRFFMVPRDHMLFNVSQDYASDQKLTSRNSE